MKLIKSLKEIDISQDIFPIFFWDEWLIYENTGRCSACLCFDEEINAIVPFKIHHLKFLVKADYIYIPLDIYGNKLSSETEKNFTDKFHSFLKKNKTCDVIYPPLHFSVFNCIPYKSLYYEIGSMFIDLTKSEENLLSGLDNDYRKKIRKAEKLNIEVFFGSEQLKNFYDTYSETHRNQGIFYESFEYFKKIINDFKDNCLVGVAYCENNIEGSIFILKDKKNAYSFYSGTPVKTIFGGSSKYLMWKTFLYLKSAGIEKYMYGGARLGDIKNSKLERIQDFKIRFGAEIVKGNHFIKIFNPIKYNLFSFALKCKSLLTGNNYSFINKSGLEIKKSK